MADKSPPASEPFPGSQTPGWNDPPTLHYPLPTGRTRLSLNKRVAYPLLGTAGGDSNAAVAVAKPTAIVQPSQNMSLPPNVPGAITQPIAVVHPMPNINAPPPMARLPSAPATFEVAIGRTVGPTDVQDSIRMLRDQAALVQESSTLRREEIERRLGLIEQLWISANLSSAVQEKLCRLAKAIAERKFNEAMEIYTALVTHHSNECSTFALALRYVVLTVQPINSESTISPAAASENVAVVPAMFVPAMPRQNSSSNETRTTGSDSGGYSAVHHI